jgi:hypothetical protein
MAIVKLEEIYLYYSDARGSVEENIGAVAFLERNDFTFSIMFYNNDSDFENLFTALNSWWSRPDINLPPIDSFPFITYVEVRDDIPARLSPVKYVFGLEEIKKFPEFYKSVHSA